MNNINDSLQVDDRIRTPLIIAIPILSYVGGSIAIFLARQELWSAMSHLMSVIGVLFGIIFVPVIAVLSLKYLRMLKQIGMTCDWRVLNEVSRHYFEIFRPNISYAIHRKWFTHLYYYSYAYAVISLLVVVFLWA